MTTSTKVLACATCGAAVPDGRVTEAKDVTVVSPGGQRHQERTLDLSTCAACSRAQEQVARIVAAHPALVASRGPGGAQRVVANVVTALAVIAQPLPRADVPDADLASLVHHLSAPGSRLAARLHVSQPGEVAPYPFAYLDQAAVEEVRAAYGGYLHERVARSAPPVRLTPSEGSARPGCLACGAGWVVVPAARVARDGRDAVRSQVWRYLVVGVSALGGTGPETLKGHLCPACASAVESVGSVGPSALARAWVAYLRSHGAQQVALAVEQAERDGGLRGLVGWGSLAAGTPPNTVPWAHIEPPEWPGPPLTRLRTRAM